MQCPKCSTSNPPEAVRCVKCVAALDGAAGAYPPPGQVAAVAGGGTTPSSAARAGHYLGYLGLILGLLACILMAWLVYTAGQGNILSDQQSQLYRILLYAGLGLGSLLGLIALILGFRAMSSGQAGRGSPSRGHAITGVVLGGIDFVVFLAGVIAVTVLATTFLPTEKKLAAPTNVPNQPEPDEGTPPKQNNPNP